MEAKDEEPFKVEEKEKEVATEMVEAKEEEKVPPPPPAVVVVEEVGRPSPSVLVEKKKGTSLYILKLPCDLIYFRILKLLNLDY